MSLTTGTRLGQYEVVSAIGAGGMGEVYRARDTRLNREVAIKILPALAAADPDLRARFEREAQVLASLNHPHIAQLYGVEDSAGMPALVMELVEGSTLDERIRAAPRGVPIDEALAIARQIADGLEAAHEQGIVHRDLKPQNVKLRPDGTVKVLDFGLAKALDPAVMRDAPDQSPTITSIGTRVGTLLGTAAYMAPEQAKGRAADRRADIWAFGVVLYELLTGTAAFAADSTSEILARVLEREPDWSRIPAATHPAILRLLRRTLVKDPKRRLQSIGDARLELEEAIHSPPVPATTFSATGPTARGGRQWILAALGAAILVALGALAGRLVRAPASGEPVAIRAAIPLGDGLYLDGVGPPVLALSPNGQTLAFVARGATGHARLYVRALDAESSTAVPGSDTAEGPFFSPDGRWVAFAVGVSVTGGMPPELRKYSLDSGLTQTVAPVADFFGGVWLADGRILFVNSQPAGVWTVPAGGGEPAPLVAKFLEQGKEVQHAIAWPAVLPGNRSILVTDWARSPIGHLAVLDLDTRELTPLGLEGAGAQLLPDGYLVYGGPDTALLAVRFDAAERRVRGTPVALMPSVAFGRNNVPVFAFSAAGTFVYSTGYLRGSRREPMRLVRAAADGSVSPLPFDPDLFYRGFAISPDGSKLAVGTWDTGRWLYDLRRGTRQKLTGRPLAEVNTIAWSPDGRRLALTGPMLGKSSWGLVVESLENEETFETIAEVPDDEIKAAGWTPDARMLVAWGMERGAGTKLRGFLQSGGGRIIATVPGSISSVRISPDGKWLAYDATTGGPFEVFVMDIDGKRRTPVNSRGGDTPRWSRDGRGLFFQREGAVLAVDVDVKGGEVLFGPERRIAQWNVGREFDVAPDGSLYAMEPVADAARQTSIQVRTNWFAQVARLVGR